jgi:hypothetical protein
MAQRIRRPDDPGIGGSRLRTYLNRRDYVKCGELFGV